MTVALPHDCAAITNVQLDYIPAEWRRTDRTPARLQILPVTGREYVGIAAPVVRDHRTERGWSAYIRANFAL